MKKLLALILAFSMLFALAACGEEKAEPEKAVPAAAEPEISEETETGETPELVGMPNPLTEMSEEELLQATGLSFKLPDGAEDVRWFTLEAENLTAQMILLLDGVKVTCRACPDSLPEDGVIKDMSGMYYDWRSEETGKVGYNDCVIKFNEGEQGWVGWYDYVPGILYNVSMDSCASAAKLIEIAEACCPPLQGEARPVEGSIRVLIGKGSDPEEQLLAIPFDLDGDGSTETVNVCCDNTRGWDEYSLYIQTGDGRAFTAETFIISKPFMRLADIDSDGCTEIFLCGDCGSDDYISYAWRFNGKELESIKFSGDFRRAGDGSAKDYGDGSIQAISDDNYLEMGSFTYMLGTYGSTMICELKPDGTIAPREGEIYNFFADETGGFWLTTKSELTAFAVNGENRVMILPSGTELYFTGTNGTDEIYFKTADGMTGAFSVALDENTGGYCVGSVYEDEAFEFLPYVG